MAFTTRCYCTVNTPTMWRRLSALGLRFNPAQPDLHASSQFLLAVCDGWFATLPAPSVGGDSVDCGENTDLFLALASYDPDTDLHQWFIYEHPDSDPVWFRCNQDDVQDAMWEDGRWRWCRRPTLEELITYFTYCY